MKKDRIIRVKQPRSQSWLYVAPNGVMVKEIERAERFTSNDAGRRVLQYLNDYSGWQFEEAGLDEIPH